MSNTKWTEDQWEAITHRGSNLLVSAAAGSGKTAVLVERIIKRITDEDDGIDIDRLLVVTFTKAAAAEMRERISAAIIKELNANPDSRHLNRQLTLLNRASITTLHSFCLEILRQYFYRINIDPGFRVADDHEAALLRSETLENMFEEHYALETPEFLALVDAYGGNRDDLILMEMVLKLHEFASINPWPNSWLENLAGDYNCPEGLPPDDIPWGREILSWLPLMLRGCREKLAQAVRLAQLPGGPEVYAENLADDMRIIDDLTAAALISWQEIYNSINAAQFGKLKSCRNSDVDDTLKERVKTLRDNVKKNIAGIREDLFSRPPEELIDDLRRVQPYVASLARLVIEFGEKYAAAKHDRGLVDFSDLEHCCLRILRGEGSAPHQTIPSEVALELQDFFAEVYVDEYQDINEVQETILSLVSRSKSDTPNRFMVGDVKQSIYGFRLADPSLFMQKYMTYPREKGRAELGIDLRQNFRSRGEVLDAVNFIFRQIMSPRLGGLKYDDKAELVCGSLYPPAAEAIPLAAGPVEVHILDKASGDNGIPGSEEFPEEAEEATFETEAAAEEHEDLDALQKEARLVGQRIIKMVHGAGDSKGPEFCVFDRKAGNYRPVQFRDIVVLLRTTRGTANVFSEEFRKLGIPAYADLGTGYFDAQEIDTVLSLLKVIDNPRQDIPLAAVLRSPIVGLNAAEMAEVRLRAPSEEFYDAVVRSAALGENDTDLKLRVFLERLPKWRTLARQGPLSELIWKLYNETGYYAYAGGMPGGAQRQANLRALYDRARQYEATSFRGLFRFLRFLEKFRDSGNDLGTARALGEYEDVVRIISIHKSKGLEFPVVITAGLGKQFNLNDLRQKVLLHKNLGIGLPVVDLEKSLTYQTIAQKGIKKRMQIELLAEEMRVLYVALTRAKEKLILVGSVKEPARAAVRWCEGVSAGGWAIPEFALMEAKHFLDWIGPALARHIDGKVIRELGQCDFEPREPMVGDVSRFALYVHDDIESNKRDNDAESNDEGIFERVRTLKPVVFDSNPEYSQDLQLLLGKLNWTYPLAEYVGKPVKVSVTELKRRFATDAPEVMPETRFRLHNLKRPAFLVQSTGLSPTERGSAMHLVMQHLNLSAVSEEAQIRDQISRMINSELLTREQADAIDLKAIQTFFGSSLGRRLAASSEVRREVPFMLSLPAERLYEDLTTGCDEYVLVQGVIDCLFSEGHGFVLIDYKTDSGPAEDTVEKYKGQLNLYSEAVEKILKKPVLERYLYLFYHGNAVRCD